MAVVVVVVGVVVVVVVVVMVVVQVTVIVVMVMVVAVAVVVAVVAVAVVVVVVVLSMVVVLLVVVVVVMLVVMLVADVVVFLFCACMDAFDIDPVRAYRMTNSRAVNTRNSTITLAHRALRRIGLGAVAMAASWAINSWASFASWASCIYDSTACGPSRPLTVVWCPLCPSLPPRAPNLLT